MRSSLGQISKAFQFYSSNACCFFCSCVPLTPPSFFLYSTAVFLFFLLADINIIFLSIIQKKKGFLAAFNPRVYANRVWIKFSSTRFWFFCFELIFNFVFYLERNANSQAAKSQLCKLCS